MQRLLAILVAGTVATTSVAAAESCPTLRAQAVAHTAKRCCCPVASQGHARLTCCTSSNTSYSTTPASEHQQSRTAAAVAPGTWSFASFAPHVVVVTPRHALVASAAGPPLLPLRI